MLFLNRKVLHNVLLSLVIWFSISQLSIYHNFCEIIQLCRHELLCFISFLSNYILNLLHPSFSSDVHHTEPFGIFPPAPLTLTCIQFNVFLCYLTSSIFITIPTFTADLSLYVLLHYYVLLQCFVFFNYLNIHFVIFDFPKLISK